MSTTTPVLRLLPPQKVADGEQVAPLQYTIVDTARLLAVSPLTVNRLIKRGELVAVGRSRLRRVLYSSILAYIERHRSDEVT